MSERKAQGSNVFVCHLSKSAAVKLLKKHEGFDPMAIERVYDYWTRKRRARKEPLLRTLQPKTAANDRDPEHTFREREKTRRPTTRRRRTVNRSDNVVEKLNEIKDEMGHVCNIFRSMVNRESAKCHVVNIYMAQKRILLDKLTTSEGQNASKLNEIRKDQEKKEKGLKKDDAEYKAKISRFVMQNVFHGNLRKMFATARGTEGEGGCDAAIARRLKKAQKRRQKVISYLVQDRNWQKWHDKNWLQRMHVVLKRRSVLLGMTRYVNQKRVWMRWEKFTKLTRERRVRKMIEMGQKRNASSGNASKTKQKGTESKEPQTSETTKKKTTVSGCSSGESKTADDTLVSDPKSMETVTMSTIDWANRQGIVPPQMPNVCKTICIPAAFNVPQNGFTCLPPRLKEMYSEAEKDAMQPPKDVSEKMEALRFRRQRIQTLMHEGQMDRNEAIIQFNQEWNQRLENNEKKKHLRKLKQNLIQNAETHPFPRATDSSDIPNPMVKEGTSMDEHFVHDQRLPVLDLELSELSVITYPKQRKQCLSYIKNRIKHLQNSTIQKERSARLIELETALQFFSKLKEAKEVNLNLIRSIVVHYSQNKSAEEGFVMDATALVGGQRKRKSVATPSKRLSKIPKSRHVSENKSIKRVSLVKRHRQRLAVEIRMQGRKRTLPLKPGTRVSVNPFCGPGKTLVPSQLTPYLTETQLKTPVPEKRIAEPEKVVPTEYEIVSNADDEASSDWNELLQRKGPVAQVPVHSVGMAKTHSAPLLVMTDDAYAGLSQSKGQRKKVMVGLGSSKRLIKGKTVSLTALKNKQRLRRALLKPLLVPFKGTRRLPKAKLRKIKALSKVKMEVPSRPQKKPIFSYVFKVNKAEASDKGSFQMKLPPCVRAEVVRSGVTRIGRGNRIWIDRVDPSSLKKPSFNAPRSSASVNRLISPLSRVLSMDQKKNEFLKKQRIQSALSRKRNEERKAQKWTEVQESASLLVSRQQNFLPFCLSNKRKTESSTKTTRPIRVKRQLDPKKEACKLHGATLEMGWTFPIDDLIRAFSARFDVDNPSIREDEQDLHEIVEIKNEAVETSSSEKPKGAKVISAKEASLEDLHVSHVKTQQVISQLGCDNADEWSIEERKALSDDHEVIPLRKYSFHERHF